VAGDLCLGACELPAGAALRSSAAALVYTYPVDALVTRTKFGKSLPNARLLGELLLAGLAARPRPDAAVPVLVPIPLHWQRLARRGFNQATEIARVVAAATGWPLRAGWLARVEPTRAQSALPRQHRQRNVAGAFRARLPAAVPVLLIDDVVTTGATALAAAEALRAAGATAVDLWAVARALAPGTPGGPPAARPRQQTGARYSAAAVKT
jgi:ComF family protein